MHAHTVYNSTKVCKNLVLFWKTPRMQTSSFTLKSSDSVYDHFLSYTRMAKQKSNMNDTLHIALTIHYRKNSTFIIFA